MELADYWANLKFGPALGRPRKVPADDDDASPRLRDPAPQLTLLDYLRLNEGAVSTKEGCAEDDCGARTVVLRGRVGDRLDGRSARLAMRLLHARVRDVAVRVVPCAGARRRASRGGQRLDRPESVPL